MADEGTIVYFDNDIQEFAVADGTAITKGTFMVISGDNTAIAHSTYGEDPLGLAVIEKVANDGKTTMGVRVRGRVTLVAGGTITRGDLLILYSTANRVVAAPAGSLSLSGIKGILGRALESATIGVKFDAFLMCG